MCSKEKSMPVDRDLEVLFIVAKYFAVDPLRLLTEYPIALYDQMTLFMSEEIIKQKRQEFREQALGRLKAKYGE
jgi:hypothetical protein